MVLSWGGVGGKTQPTLFPQPKEQNNHPIHHPNPRLEFLKTTKVRAMQMTGFS